MSKEKLKSNKPFRSVWQWLENKIVQTVPEDCVVCEFDCHKCQCTLGEWEICARRFNKAAGEPTPRPDKDLRVTDTIRKTQPSAISPQSPGE